MISVRSLVLLMSLVALTAAMQHKYFLVSVIKEFAQLYQKIDSDSRQVAEHFASLVGNHRLYHFTLMTFPGDEQVVTYERVEKFLEEFGDHMLLNRTTDSDAATETMAHILGTNMLRKIENKEQVLELLKRIPGHFCANYVKQLGQEIFESAAFKSYISNKHLFGAELAELGSTNEVKQFMLGWAHYQICRSLIFNNHDKLVYKFYRRLNDYLDQHPEFPKEPSAQALAEGY